MNGASDQGDLRVAVLRTADEIEAIRPQWEAFEPCPNADPSFFLTVVNSRPDIVGPYVFALMRGQTLEGLFVARLEDTYYRCLVANRTVYRTRVRSLTIVYGGALRGRADVPWDPLIAALTGAMRTGVATVASFHRLDADSELVSKLRTAVSRRWRNDSELPELHWHLDLPDTFDALLARPGARSVRRKLRQWSKTLEKDFPGQVVVRRTRTPEEVPDFCRRAEIVARGSYQRGLGTGFVHDAGYEARLLLAARRGRLRAYDLEVGGSVRSFWITELAGRTLHVDASAFEAEFSRWEPGTVLLIEILKDAIAEGVKELDYGFGDAVYKRRFEARSSSEIDIYLFRPGLRGAWLNFMRRLVAALSRWAKQLATRLRIWDRLRQLMRKSARSRLPHGTSGDAGASAGGEAESD